MANSGPNSGRPDFSAGSEGGTNSSQSYLNFPYPETSSDPLLQMPFGSFSGSDILELLQSSTTMGTQINSQQYGQPAGTSSRVVHDQHLTNTNVSRTGTSEILTPEQTVNLRKREADRAYRERQKLEKIQMQKDLGRLSDENANLRAENESLKLDNASMNEILQSQAKTIDQLGRDLAKLKSNNEMQNAAEQHLAELLQLRDLKFIKEGDKHSMKPTQDPSPSYEDSAGNLDGGGSKDEIDSNKKKKRVAHLAPRERHSGKFPKFACDDARADQVIDPYSITECLRILKTMGDIPYPIVKKATAKFRSPDEREIFVGLTQDWKEAWVKDLENDG